MSDMKKSNQEYYEIGVLTILKAIFRRLWIVIISAILIAGICFALSVFVIKPKYSSSVTFYVNNGTFANNLTINSSQIDAAQKLVNTYNEILNHSSTYEMIIEQAGVHYTPEELSDMIKSGPLNETEIMYVTVTSDDPYEAIDIVVAISEILPKRISNIVDGSSVVIVDEGIPSFKKVSPSIFKYTIIGFLMGGFLAVAGITIAAMLDKTVHDEKYVTHTYNCPMLAKVTDLMDNGHIKKRYGYYKSSKEYRAENTKKEEV